MSAPRRFVLLRHTGHGTTHFDFMIEDDAALATWQFDESPALLALGGVLTCRRLAAHRTAYLDYEGPISDGRGNVQRDDRGTCHVIRATDTRWELEISGMQLRNRFVLSRDDGTSIAWKLSHG